MIEVPKELQRLIIKEKFRGLSYKEIQTELIRLADLDEIKNLLPKLERSVYVDFIHGDPEFNITDDSFSVGWFGFIEGRAVRVDIVWEYSGREFRNYILATEEDGEEEILREL